MCTAGQVRVGRQPGDGGLLPARTAGRTGVRQRRVGLPGKQISIYSLHKIKKLYKYYVSMNIAFFKMEQGF